MNKWCKGVYHRRFYFCLKSNITGRSDKLHTHERKLRIKQDYTKVAIMGLGEIDLEDAGGAQLCTFRSREIFRVLGNLGTNIGRLDRVLTRERRGLDSICDTWFRGNAREIEKMSYV